MNGPASQLIRVRLSLLCCDRNGAKALTVLDRNQRTRTLPHLMLHPHHFSDLEQEIRTQFGSKLASQLRGIEQIETVCEAGNLVCDVVGLVAEQSKFRPLNSDWWPLFDLFPWEDWRKCTPKIVRETLVPQLLLWAKRFAPDPLASKTKILQLFASEQQSWCSEHLVQRYDILYQAGLLPEALRDRSGAAISVRRHHVAVFGQTMKGRDRRQLGLAVSRLRSHVKTRPVFASLLTGSFSLGDLQKAAEHLTGLGLHTQNFRRDILRTGLIEPVEQNQNKLQTHTAKQYNWAADLDIATSDVGIPLPRKKC